MANEFKHKDPGSELTQAEFIAACGDGHIFACQATGDIVYASSATVLSKLAKGSAGTVLSMGCSCIPAWTTNAASATLAATVTVIDSTDTSSFVALFDSATGDLAAKTDAGLAYNSGTGTLTATAFAGPITGNVTGNASGTALTVTQAAQCAITSLGTLTGLTLSGDATLTGAATDVDLIDNNACAISFDAAGQAGILAIDTQNCAEGVKMSGKLTVPGAISSTGALTVGVDDTGHDVKFFGAAAGAYMLYDQSCDQLEIRGASADATTSTGKLLLSTSLTNVNANDVIGSINFQAPAEAGGSDAIAIAAGIRAVAQATFTCAVNSTDLIFYTGPSEAATEKFRCTCQGAIGIGGANYGTDGQVLTSGGAGAAPAWEDAASGGVTNVAGSCSAVVINECGGNVDFRVESQNNANALVIDGAAFNGVGVWGIGGGTSGAHVLVNHPATTITACDNFYRFYVGNSNAITVPSGTSAIVASLRVNEPNITETGTLTTGATVYIPGAPSEGASNYCLFIDDGVSRFVGQLQAANGCASTPGFAFKCDTDVGFYRAAGNELGVSTNGTARFLFKGEEFHIGDCANGNMSVGLNIEQGGADNEILALKSSDVTHAITDEAETDTYGLFKKAAAIGGLHIRGLAATAGNYGMLLDGINVGNVDVDKSTGSAGYITIRAQLKSTNSVGVVGANQNLLVVRNHTTSRFILDSDGDSHQDVGTAWTNFDDFNDLEVMDSIRMTLDRDPLGRGFVESLESRRELLEAMPGKPIVTFNNDGHHFVNTSRLAMLHHGAILQMNANLTERISDLEAKIQELKALEGN